MQDDTISTSMNPNHSSKQKLALLIRIIGFCIMQGVTRGSSYGAIYGAIYSTSFGATIFGAIYGMLYGFMAGIALGLINGFVIGFLSVVCAIPIEIGHYISPPLTFLGGIVTFNFIIASDSTNTDIFEIFVPSLIAAFAAWQASRKLTEWYEAEIDVKAPSE